MADIDRKNSDMLDRMNGCDILFDRNNGCDELDRMNGCDVLDGKND